MLLEYEYAYHPHKCSSAGMNLLHYRHIRKYYWDRLMP